MQIFLTSGRFCANISHGSFSSGFYVSSHCLALSFRYASDTMFVDGTVGIHSEANHGPASFLDVRPVLCLVVLEI